MVSDQEIANCVESLLRQPGPDGSVSSVNVSGVVQQVEAKLGLDLSHKEGFIRDQIEILLRSSAGASKDQGSLQQQQFFSSYPQQLLQQHQVSSSASSSHFSPTAAQDDLAFRCTPAVKMQSLPLVLQQQQECDAQQLQQPAVSSVQEAHGSPESSLPKPAKASAEARSKRRRGPGGLTKLCGVSPLLQNIVGGSTLPRTEIVKQLWAYIRKNNLQDPNNKRKIICNDELRVVFETDCTDIFMMNKLLAKHIMPLEPSKVPAGSKKKMKTMEVPEGEVESFPVIISDELAKFFGTGEREMLQSEAFKRILDYIKIYKLKDPTNSKMILCDAKLQQLFGCEMIPDQGIFEMLSRHLLKKS